MNLTSLKSGQRWKFKLLNEESFLSAIRTYSLSWKLLSLWLDVIRISPFGCPPRRIQTICQLTRIVEQSIATYLFNITSEIRKVKNQTLKEFPSQNFLISHFDKTLFFASIRDDLLGNLKNFLFLSFFKWQWHYLKTRENKMAMALFENYEKYCLSNNQNFDFVHCSFFAYFSSMENDLM